MSLLQNARGLVLLARVTRCLPSPLHSPGLAHAHIDVCTLTHVCAHTAAGLWTTVGALRLFSVVPAGPLEAFLYTSLHCQPRTPELTPISSATPPGCSGPSEKPLPHPAFLPALGLSGLPRGRSGEVLPAGAQGLFWEATCPSHRGSWPVGGDAASHCFPSGERGCCHHALCSIQSQDKCLLQHGLSLSICSAEWERSRPLPACSLSGKVHTWMTFPSCW